MNIMKGFPINMNKERMIAGYMTSFQLAKAICDPRSMKNKTMKKSLSGFIFAAISEEKGVRDKMIPAKSAPISMEKPNEKKSEEMPNPHATANKKSISCEEAKNLPM